MGNGQKKKYSKNLVSTHREKILRMVQEEHTAQQELTNGSTKCHGWAKSYMVYGQRKKSLKSQRSILRARSFLREMEQPMAVDTPVVMDEYVEPVEEINQ